MNTPATLNAASLVSYCALVNLDPHTFIDDLAGEIARDNENDQRNAEEVLLAAIDETADDQLTRFAVRLALTGHLGISREGETDFLTEAATALALPPPTKKSRTKQPTPIKAGSTAKPGKRPAKKFLLQPYRRSAAECHKTALEQPLAITNVYGNGFTLYYGALKKTPYK